jgi:dTDP-4-dehydrorhamnose 3,5-epimerase
VRGLHFQADPHGETKLVRCVRGALYDVIVDLRRDSPTYLQSFGVELSAEEGSALYIPVGIAHGFQTLLDETDALYMIDAPYVQAAATGIRWNDPAIAVTWPLPITVISEPDTRFQDWPKY